MGKAKKSHEPSGKASGAGRGGGADERIHPSVATLLDPPALREYLPELEAEELVPDNPGFIMLLHDMLSPAECSRIIAAMESPHGSPAACGIALHPPDMSDLRPKKNEALLNRDSCAVTDPPLATALWERLLPHLPRLEGRKPVGLVGDKVYAKDMTTAPNQLKFYRYVRGHSFGLHVDVSRKGQNPGEMSEYTLLYYLNSKGEPVSLGGSGSGTASQNVAASGGDHPLVGGDTIFMATAKAELCRVAPRAGTAMLHAHGKRCLLHEGELVSKGVKYMMRADVMYGPAES